jgi:hypothetical protein
MFGCRFLEIGRGGTLNFRFGLLLLAVLSEGFLAGSCLALT